MVPFLVSGLSDFAQKVPSSSWVLSRSLCLRCQVHAGAGAFPYLGNLHLPGFCVITLLDSCCCFPCPTDHCPPDL